MRNALLLTCMTEFAAILVLRGVYYYASYDLSFSQAQNLLLGLAFGIPYSSCAFWGYKLTKRMKDRHALSLALLIDIFVPFFMWMLAEYAMALMLPMALLGLAAGLKWPVIESFISAGKNSLQTASAIGKFSLCWSGMGALAVFVSGSIIQQLGEHWFLVACAFQMLAAVQVLRFPLAAPHRPREEFELPKVLEKISLYRRYLLSSRCLLLLSYASGSVILAELPAIFHQLNHTMSVATSLASIMEIVCFGSFLVMQHTASWHGKGWPMVLGMIFMPLSALLILTSPTTAGIICGEVVFGMTQGAMYYCALYYGMVVKNAAVDAGGTHEALIGLGFAVGPAVGLLGTFFGEHLAWPAVMVMFLLGIPALLFFSRNKSLAKIPDSQRDMAAVFESD